AQLLDDAGPEYRERAIARHQTLLRSDPQRTDSYRALERLYGESGKPERSRACTDVLSFLDGHPQKPVALVHTERPLDAEAWARLSHPAEERLISALLGWLAPSLARARAVSHRRVGLRRADRVADG